MLKTFEEITPDIKPEEEVMAKNIAASINNKAVGKENAVSNKKIRDAILTKYGAKYHPIRIRKMITYIRVCNLVPCLCSNSKGYYRAANEDEWNSWKISMQQRINQMQNTLDAAIFFNDGHEKL